VGRQMIKEQWIKEHLPEKGHSNKTIYFILQFTLLHITSDKM